MVHGEDPLCSRGSSTTGIGKTSQQNHLATASTFPVLDAGQPCSEGVRALNGESLISEQNGQRRLSLLTVAKFRSGPACNC